jgi:transcriptional regulator of acetoin/glycerol metabolism
MPGDGGDLPSAAAEHIGRWREVQAERTRLRDRQGEILRDLHDKHGWTVRRMAAALGISKSRVHQLMYPDGAPRP